MSTVAIGVGGSDLSDAIIYSSARFVASTNGKAGTCTFRIRDDAHVQEPIPGQEITLDIDSEREWTGWVSAVRRGYFVNGTDKSPADVERYFEIEGVDLNILFQKRVLYDKVTPAKMQLTTYPPGTDDGEILYDYMDDHLDLSTDNLGRSLIENVGTPSTDAQISGAAGWTWDQFMRFLTHNTGALYYIRPDREVVLTDVDTEDAPFSIADVVPEANSIETAFDTDLGEWESSEGVFAVVDGALQVGPASWDQATFDAKTIPMPTTWGFMFYTPADPSDGYYAWELDAFGRFIYIDNTGSEGVWSIGNTLNYFETDLDTETWYHIKAYAEEGISGACRLKVWKDGDPEPDDWQVDTTVGVTGAYGHYVYMESTGASPARMKNLFIIEGDGAQVVGCRELEIDEGGEQLRNDVLAWGIGQGSSQPVFSRSTDDTSIGAHGLWQLGVMSQVVWRQETIDRIADSYVYGSPQNKRGGKDDAVSVRCAVFERGIKAGMKATVSSQIYGFEETLPVRRSEISFPTPTRPRWDLILSHEIDDPWSTFEFWFPDFSLPDFDFDIGINIGNIIIPPFDPCDHTQISTVCVSDDFDRVVSGDWGSGDELIWAETFNSNNTLTGVSSGVAFATWTTSGHASLWQLAAITIDPLASQLDLFFDFDFTVPGGGSKLLEGYLLSNGLSGGAHVKAAITYDSGADTYTISFFLTDADFNSWGTEEIVISATPGTPQRVHLRLSPSLVQGSVWDASTSEPGSFQISETHGIAGALSQIAGGLNKVLAFFLGDNNNVPHSTFVDNVSFCYTVAGTVGEAMGLFEGSAACIETFTRTSAGGDGLGVDEIFGLSWPGSSIYETVGTEAKFHKSVAHTALSGGFTNPIVLTPVGFPAPNSEALEILIKFRCAREDVRILGNTLLYGRWQMITSAQATVGSEAAPYNGAHWGVGIEWGPGVAVDSGDIGTDPGGPDKITLGFKLFGANFLVQPVSFTDGVDIHIDQDMFLRWRQDENGRFAKLWNAGNTEPEDWSTSSAGVNSSATNRLWFQYSGVRDQNFYFDSYEIVEPCDGGGDGGNPCADADPREFQDPPRSGDHDDTLEEVDTPDGGDDTSTWFQTDHQFLNGSERVYLNGKLLRPGVDYSRHPVDRLIEVFSSVTISPGDVLYADYEIFLSTPAPEIL